MSAVTPDLKLPEKIRSRRQWVRLSKLARDVLVKYHRGDADDFIRVGDTEPSISGGPFYPRSFQRVSRLGGSIWLEKLPRNGIVYWPDGVDICSEPYDPRDPVEMLREIQFWSHCGSEFLDPGHPDDIDSPYPDDDGPDWADESGCDEDDDLEMAL